MEISTTLSARQTDRQLSNNFDIYTDCGKAIIYYTRISGLPVFTLIFAQKHSEKNPISSIIGSTVMAFINGNIKLRALL